MEVTCAGCGYKGPESEFQEKASKVEALRRKKAREEGEELEPGMFGMVVCPKCGHDGLLYN